MIDETVQEVRQELLTVSEAARARNGVISEAGLRGQIAEGNLPAIKLGGRVFVTRAALHTLLIRRAIK